MESYYIGYKFTVKELKKVAAWCNMDGTCHVEEDDEGMMVVVENHVIDDPGAPTIDDTSLADRVKELEAQNEFLTECLIEIGNIIYA